MIMADEDATKSNRPKDNRLFQQHLRAWQPLLTAKDVAPFFLVIALIFIVLGAVLLHSSNQIFEVSIPYTSCTGDDGVLCADLVLNRSFTGAFQTCKCKVNFTVDANVTGSIYLYYALTNYFQNHRRYVKSRDDDQLQGKTKGSADNCAPYTYANETFKLSPYAPCGAIANTLFNDSFAVYYKGEDGSKNVTIAMSNKDIAWWSDVHKKFGTIRDWSGTVKPANWPISEAQRNQSGYAGDEELLVWMRTAPLPNFRKLHRRVDHANADPLFRNGLPKGRYELYVDYAYPVTEFEGTKSVILTTTSWMGGKNPTLGVLYLFLGCLYVLLAIIFLAIHIRATKRKHSRSSAATPIFSNQ